MKKVIALLSIFALAFVLTPVMAGNVFEEAADIDDSFFNMNNDVDREFEVKHRAKSKLKSDLTIISDTGHNFITVGDDFDQGGIITGQATLAATEQYDVNGLELTYTDWGSFDDNEIEKLTDWDDSFVNQDNELDDEQEIKSDLKSKADLDTEVIGNTGDNFVSVGGDVGEDGPVVLETKDSGVLFDRVGVFNLLRVVRLPAIP